MSGRTITIDWADVQVRVMGARLKVDAALREMSPVADALAEAELPSEIRMPFLSSNAELHRAALVLAGLQSLLGLLAEGAHAHSVAAPSAPLIPRSRAEEGWLCAWCSERGTGPLPEKHRGHTGEHELVTRARAEEMVAEERERCAAIARKHAGRRCDQERTPTYVSFICGWTDASQVIEADIRARNTEASRG